jgi:hypothetical protein
MGNQAPRLRVGSSHCANSGRERIQFSAGKVTGLLTRFRITTGEAKHLQKLKLGLNLDAFLAQVELQPITTRLTGEGLGPLSVVNTD